MYFQHSPQIWSAYPELAAGAIHVNGITSDVDLDRRIRAFESIAAKRIADTTEAELTEIQAWRRTFARMGLKPTQYRCASESLLRRFRKVGALPRIHPLVDLCNAISIAYAVPIAALDVAMITGGLEVRQAQGDEIYQTFNGDTEHPAVDEVTFVDDSGRAHARRWSNRQSGHSAVRDTTASALIVTEGMHSTAATDIGLVLDTVTAEVAAAWDASPASSLLTETSPRFEF